MDPANREALAYFRWGVDGDDAYLGGVSLTDRETCLPSTARPGE